MSSYHAGEHSLTALRITHFDRVKNEALKYKVILLLVGRKKKPSSHFDHFIVCPSRELCWNRFPEVWTRVT